MFSFDVHSFYKKGYTAGFLPKEIQDDCREIINTTNWKGDDHVQYADWNLLEEENGQDAYYQETLRELKSLNCAPPEMKYVGDCILNLPYFDDLKKRLVKPQHKDTTWVTTFQPNGYGMWNRQDNLNWHNDTNDGNDIVILAYFTDEGKEWDRSWDGQIKVGVEDDNGSINEVYEHYPIDSTFIVLNNMNPLFYHRVKKNADNTNRYTMSFRYLIK